MFPVALVRVRIGKPAHIAQNGFYMFGKVAAHGLSYLVHLSGQPSSCKHNAPPDRGPVPEEKEAHIIKGPPYDLPVTLYKMKFANLVSIFQFKPEPAADKFPDFYYCLV